MTNFSQKTISEIHDLLTAKKLSVKRLTAYFLEQIKLYDRTIAAFLQINKEALSMAEQFDKSFLNKTKVPFLWGIPAAIKDNILVKGLQATAGSQILKNYKAAYNATAIKKLQENKIIFLGKTNLDEFAMGSSTENSSFGATKNPFDLNRVPGGSSGGSAAAVAAGECLFALGSDTGGSIRQPAAFCGIVGLKPTYGAVSRYGLIALASSLDVIGPLAKSVRDVAEVFRAIRGQDPLDSTSQKGRILPSWHEIQKNDPKELRIGIPEEYFPPELDGQIRKKIDNLISSLAKEGFNVTKIRLRHTQYALAVYYILMPSEASANLARFDTLRYGANDQPHARSLIDFYIKARTKYFGSEVQRRIMLGVYSLSSGYYDDYYQRAQAMRNIISHEFSKAFREVDIILTPTTPTVAFQIGEKMKPLDMYLSDIFTVPASLAGLPALSLPIGTVKSLPIGLQLIARPFREDQIFRLAQYLEEKIGFRDREKLLHKKGGLLHEEEK